MDAEREETLGVYFAALLVAIRGLRVHAQGERSTVIVTVMRTGLAEGAGSQRTSAL
jgi:hypothetical protein